MRAYLLSLSCLFCGFSVMGQEYYPESEQAQIKALWPGEFPARLKFYRPTRLSQRSVVTGSTMTVEYFDRDQDQHFANDKSEINQNRLFPYAVPGGLQNAKGWRSFTGVVTGPEIERWHEVFPFRGAAGGFLRKRNWSYPPINFFDLLVNDDGRAFEVRNLEKTKQGWEAFVIYRDPEARPQGFTRVKSKDCLACHKDAGNPKYGIAVRGNDFVFSYLPGKDW